MHDAWLFRTVSLLAMLELCMHWDDFSQLCFLVGQLHQMLAVGLRPYAAAVSRVCCYQLMQHSKEPRQGANIACAGLSPVSIPWSMFHAGGSVLHAQQQVFLLSSAFLSRWLLLCHCLSPAVCKYLSRLNGTSSKRFLDCDAHTLTQQSIIVCCDGLIGKGTTVVTALCQGSTIA